MKWSFLAGLLTSAAVLAPISASAKAETVSSAHMSARLISGRLLNSKFGARLTHKNTGDSHQVTTVEGQATSLPGDTLGRGGESSKAKSPDIQLSRGLGSGGGEGGGGGSPSQRAPSVKKDNGLVARSGMSAVQQSTANGTPVDGERGPSLASGSRTDSTAFSMPTPVSITVGQDPQGASGPGTSTGSSSGSVSPRAQTQDTSSSSSPSPSSFSESPSSESISSSVGSSGGGGGSSASQEGVVFPSEAVKEYQQLRAAAKREKDKDTIPAPLPKSSEFIEKMANMTKRMQLTQDTISPVTLGQAKGHLKKVVEVSPNETGSKAGELSGKKESVAIPSHKQESQKLGSLSSSPRIYGDTSIGGKAKTSGGILSMGMSVPEDVQRATQLLGFDLNTDYKSETEALDELRKKASGKTTANDNALEKIYNAMGDKEPTSKQIEEIRRLATENDSIGEYKKTLTEFLKKKYDKSQVNPTEKDREAAQLIGFNLSTAFKDETEALDELRKKASGKTTANDNALEKIYNAMGDKEPTSKQIEEIRRLATENDSIDQYKKTLTEFLKKKYAVVKKGRQIIQVSGKDIVEQMANLAATSSSSGKKTRTKEPTLKEIGVELDTTIKALRNAEEEYESLRLSDAEDEQLKEVATRINKLKETKVSKVFAYEKKREQEKPLTKKPSSSVKVDPLKAAKEQEALKLFKETRPTLTPVLDILNPADQIKLLTRKVTVFYDTNTRKQVLEQRKLPSGKVIQGATQDRMETVVAILSRLSLTERDSLVDYVKSLEIGARLSALAYIPNYVGIAKYKFPDLEKPIPTPVTPSKKPLVKEVKVEEVAPPSVPTVRTPEKKLSLKERMELLKGQTLTGGRKLPLGSKTTDKDDL